MPGPLTTIKRRVGRLVANLLGAAPFVPGRQRWRLLGLIDVSARGAMLESGTTFAGTAPVRFAEGVFVNRNCFFEAGAPITLGAGVALGPQVTILTSTHEIGAPDLRQGRAFSEPVVVGDGVWVGARATILPGVTIGSGCVIAAGALVRVDCEPNGLYAGVPARRVRDLPS